MNRVLTLHCEMLLSFGHNFVPWALTWASFGPRWALYVDETGSHCHRLIKCCFEARLCHHHLRSEFRQNASRALARHSDLSTDKKSNDRCGRRRSIDASSKMTSGCDKLASDETCFVSKIASYLEINKQMTSVQSLSIFGALDIYVLSVKTSS